MALITMRDIEKISPIFKGEKGNSLANKLLRITGIDKLSERYSRHEDLQGPEFVEAFLKDLDVDYQVGGIDNLKQLAEGPFITISNHPYGGLDGLILIDLIGHFRNDFKVMANQFLNLVKTIKNNFISVIPTTRDAIKVTNENIAGVRMFINQIKNGSPLGVFPSGAVSDLHLNGVRDREWQSSAIRLIQKMNVPVLPVRFFDKNSYYFYLLGWISWKVRVLRLPKEVLNKVGKQVRIGLGPIISVEEQLEQKSEEAFGQLLRRSVYDMDMPDDFIKRSQVAF